MKLRRTVFLLVTLVCCRGFADETGELRMQFKFKGKRPDPIPLKLPASCGSLKMTDETLIVSGNNNGIMNVVVYVYNGRGGTKLPPGTPRNKKLSLACWNCRFVPRISMAQAGDSIRIRNMDKIGYNINFSFFQNEVQNLAMPAGHNRMIELENAEPTVVPMACNILPWMVGYVLVTDHPYYGVTDPDGELVIRDLPIGKLVFRAWHERGTFKDQIFVNGKKSQWKANKFTVDIKPGKNDFGVVELPPDAFGLDQAADSPID